MPEQKGRMTEAELAQACQRDPLWMSRAIIGERLPVWSKQREVIQSAWTARRTVCASGHAVGKSFAAARLAIMFLTAFAGSRVVITAPGNRQVRDVLWQEIKRQYSNSETPLSGTPKDGRMVIEGSADRLLVCFATQADTVSQEADKMQGYHSETGNILVIFEEASGILPAIWNAANGIMVGSNAHFLAIGNPLRAGDDFEAAYNDKKYHRIHISSFDSPNITGEGGITYPGLADWAWIEDATEQYGKGTPAYCAHVLGEFPSASEDTIIPRPWVERAFKKHIEVVPAEHQPVIGIDVARGGNSATVFTCAFGPVVERIEVKKSGPVQQDPAKAAEFAILLALDMVGDERVHTVLFAIDDTGAGCGTTNALRDAGMQVLPINFGAKDFAGPHYRDDKAAMYWQLRRLFQRDGVGLTAIADLPGLPAELAAQLSCQRYRVDKTIAVESKKELEKRGIKSPDVADSAALALGAPLLGDRRVFPLEITEHHRTDSADMGAPRRERLVENDMVPGGVELVGYDGEDWCWHVWLPAQEGHDYAVFGRPGEGVLLDPKDPRSGREVSAAVVLDRTDMEFCAELVMGVDDSPESFGEELRKAGLHYNEAYVTPEMAVPAPGVSALNVLIESGYRRIYQRPTPPDVYKDAWTEYLGWKTTNRDTSIDEYLAACRIDEVEGWTPERLSVYSRTLVEQEEAFIYSASGRRQARKGTPRNLLLAAMGAVALHAKCPRTTGLYKDERPKPLPAACWVGGADPGPEDW